MNALQSNVVPLRHRRGRPRKALPRALTGTVLAFPSPKRFVYHPVNIADSRQEMFDMLQAASFSVLRGEISGIMVTIADGSDEAKTQFGIFGSFADDLDFAASALGDALEVVEDSDAHPRLLPK